MNYALVFAGGVGNRMNCKGKPKQFLEIHGKPILIHTLEHFERHKNIDAICLVIVKDWIDYAQELVQKYGLKKVKWVVSGGKDAIDSQYNGLLAIKKSDCYSDESIVLIHDGVRPLINEELITNCINNTKKHGSAITVAPAIETIIRSDSNSCIMDTFSRSECLLARAPQTFYFNDILETHEKAKAKNVYNFVDSTSLMLYFGKKLYTIEGPAENIKVTTPADFYTCRALLDAKEEYEVFGV